MIHPPLFGIDSSPQYTAPRLAGIGTGIFTLIFSLIVIFVPGPKPKEKYETIRIVLDTTPLQDVFNEPGESSGEMAEPFEEISEPVIAETPAIPETPVTSEEKVVEKTIVTETPKQVESPKAAETVKPKVEEPKWTKRTDNDWASRKTMDELLAEQAENRSSSLKDFDESAFDFGSNISESQTQTVQKNKTSEPALSGSAAIATKETNDRQATTSTISGKLESTVVDENVSNALSGISNTEYKEKTYSNSNSTVKMKTAETSGGTSVSMNDGTSRLLQKPKVPRISIPSDLADEINQSITVTISFSVLADGSVPESSVQIIPRSLISDELFSDIAFQLSTWKFDSGSSKATASFAFTIEKKN